MATTTTTTRRVGPMMELALEYIRQNPGCSKLAVAEAVTRSPGVSPTGHGQYEVVDRLIRAGLVRAERGPGNRYRLYAS